MSKESPIQGFSFDTMGCGLWGSLVLFLGAWDTLVPSKHWMCLKCRGDAEVTHTRNIPGLPAVPKAVAKRLAGGTEAWWMFILEHAFGPRSSGPLSSDWYGVVPRTAHSPMSITLPLATPATNALRLGPPSRQALSCLGP